MPDRPQSTAPPPPDPRHPSTWPEVIAGEHPIRESFLVNIHVDFRDALVAPLALLYEVLIALRGPDAAVYCGDASLPAAVGAVVRDLRWSAAFIRGGIVGQAQGSTLSYEEEGLCRFAAEFSFRLDALTAELETFLADWQPGMES